MPDYAQLEAHVIAYMLRFFGCSFSDLERRPIGEGRLQIVHLPSGNGYELLPTDDEKRWLAVPVPMVLVR